MALPDAIRQIAPSAANRIIFADATDWVDGDWGADDAQIDLTGVVAGEARESIKKALPTNMELDYDVFLLIEFATAPVSGETVDVYYGLSPSGTAGTDNPAGLVGADGDYTGTAGDSLDDSLAQLEYIGSMVCTLDATTVIQQAFIGTIPAPTLPQIMLVVDNNTSDAFFTDAAEMAIVLVGKEIQIQD